MVVAVSVLLVAVGAACEPLPPALTFTVSTTVDGPDAVAGDGVCEMTSGAGDCSLRAGIEEADAASGASAATPVVVVPAGTYGIAEPVVVSGRVHLLGSTATGVRIDHHGITVGDGGAMTVEQVDLAAILFGPGWQVDGHLLVRRATVTGFAVAVRVGPTGVLVAEHSQIQGAFGTTIRNEGVVGVRFSTVAAVYESVAIDTTGAGATYLRSSALLSPVPPRGLPGGGTACVGTAPVSLGYTTAWGTSCGLVGVGDQEGVNPYEGPQPGSPLLDAIPVGVDGCGEVPQLDLLGASRPIDGDGDGVAACDIGAVEHQP